MKKRRLSYIEKISMIKAYQKGEGSYEKIAKKNGINKRTLVDLVARYQSQGDEGIQHKRKNKKYSEELKIQAVLEYSEGELSQQEICSKYKINGRGILRQWIKVYNGHKKLKAHHSAGWEIYMTKGRKTTQQERTEIVVFCIEHEKDYPLTIEKYGVSYQQIYSWLRKYEEKGVNGLADGRGRTKPMEEMTEIEKLRAENRILQAKNYDLEMENAFIKKLRELEEGGR